MPQAPLFTVHWNTCVPTGRPVIWVVAEFAFVMVPVPLTSVQVPVAGAGADVAFIVTPLPGVQMAWSGPAFAVAPGVNTVTTTSSCVIAAHGPLSMLHRKRLMPGLRPLTWVLGWLAFVKVPVPCTTVHVPTAGAAAVLPARVVVVNGAHSCWSGPAFAAACVGE